MDYVLVALQKSRDRGLIQQVQVGLPSLEPVAEPGDTIHLHWNRRGQKPLLLNTL
jgi:hypothetical protein